jgi:hypothetical protein
MLRLMGLPQPAEMTGTSLLRTTPRTPVLPVPTAAVA